MKRTLTYTQFKKIVLGETSRRQKAQHAFLGHMNNIKNFGIFSPENPMGELLSPVENRERAQKFETLLKRGHYIFHKIKGSYSNIEHSYMIYNIPLDELKHFGSEELFNQESFFLCKTYFDEDVRQTKVEFTYFKKDAPQKNFHEIETSEQYLDATSFDDYFSMIGRNFKFSIAMDEFGNKLESANKTYESAKAVLVDFETILDESIDSKYTGRKHWLRRNTLKKGINEADERGLMMLDETSLSRLIGKHKNTGYIMISACRDSSLKGKSLEEIEKQAEINNANTESLRKDIQNAGYSYIRVNGGYVERGVGDEDDVEVEEKSFIVFNFKKNAEHDTWDLENNIDELKDFGIKMAMKYNQDSVLVVAPGEDPTYYAKDGSIDFSLSHNMAVNDLAQDFFTQLHKGNKRMTFLPITAESVGHTINGIRSRRLRGELCVLG